MASWAGAVWARGWTRNADSLAPPCKVMAAKSMPTDRPNRCCGLVHTLIATVVGFVSTVSINDGRLTDEISELRRLIDGISERGSGIEGQLYVIRERLRIADTPSP